MMRTFYRVSRCVTNDNGKLRLTEIRTAGRYTDAGKEQITACCGKSAPCPAKHQENAASAAA